MKWWKITTYLTIILFTLLLFFLEPYLRIKIKELVIFLLSRKAQYFLVDSRPNFISVYFLGMGFLGLMNPRISKIISPYSLEIALYVQKSFRPHSPKTCAIYFLIYFTLSIILMPYVIFNEDEIITNSGLIRIFDKSHSYEEITEITLGNMRHAFKFSDGIEQVIENHFFYNVKQMGDVRSFISSKSRVLINKVYLK